MSRQFLETPIHEGFNNVGVIEITVTEFESTTKASEVVYIDASAQPTNLLFKLQFTSADNPPVNEGYTANFSVSAISGEQSFNYSTHPNSDGFIDLKSELFPIVSIGHEFEDRIIRLSVEGSLESRPGECYIRILKPGGGPSDYLYTLIRDVVVHNFSGVYKLAVFDGASTYYAIQPTITVTEAATALYINRRGSIYQFVGSDWTSISGLRFVKFDNPAATLHSYTDGFYTYTGPIEEGIHPNQIIGDPGQLFPNNFLKLSNSEPHYVDVTVTVTDMNGDSVTLTSGTFNNKQQGSLNYSKVSMSSPPAVADDNSPTLSELAAIAGPFEVLRPFLEVKGLDSVNEVRNAGPISYLDGFDKDNPTLVSQAKTIQSYVDLHNITKDLTQSKRLITKGYTDFFTIGNTDKNVFITDVEGASGINTIRAAQLHEVIVQGQKLFANVLTGTMIDMMAEGVPSESSATSSTFGAKIAATTASSCGCDDCQSNISPFSYLFDLINYSFSKVKYNNAKSVTLKLHANLLEGKFLQPFGQYKVDCETLHDEYCRVRLVTEVLEAAIPTTPAHPVLDSDRQDFFWLVYNSILVSAGTSLTEIRDIYAIQDSEKKIEVSQKLSDRLGIPLYDPLSPGTLTSSSLWKTKASLSANFLQWMFGFRSTQLSPLSTVGISWYEQWEAQYLKDLWLKTDYPFTAYTRETLNTSNPSAIVVKDEWKPIIDPDIMGWDDLTYLTSPVASSLYKYRKNDTDSFMNKAIKDPINLSVTSADMTGRIVRVVDRDLLSHKFENDKIWLESPSGTWGAFNVLSKSINLIDTDVSLKQSTPAISQPAMVQPYTNLSIPYLPKMRYKRVLSVASGDISIAASSPYNIAINWNEDVIADRLSGGTVKLISDGNTVITYDGTTTPALTYVSSTPSTMNLLLSAAPDSNFLNGTISFVYDVEVTLFTTSIVDPELLTAWLFKTTANKTWTYNLMTPTAYTPTSYDYTVWTVPNWYSITGATNYKKLKNLYLAISNGSAGENEKSIVLDDLRMSLDDFSRMMKVMIACEVGLLSMYTTKIPTESELYDMASIIRNSFKPLFRADWIIEEIRHTPTSGSPAMLRLNLRHFWRALKEPKIGPWDPTLQTIPANASQITSRHVPLIDPELIDKDDIISHPSNAPYLALWDSRKSTLDTLRAFFYNTTTGLSNAGVNVFSAMLNFVATGVSTIPYNISPYTSLDSLVNDLNSSVTYKKLKAQQKIWSVFMLEEEDFISVVTTKTAFESGDPVKQPTSQEIDRSYSILISAYKRKHYYNGLLQWIPQEISGFTLGSVVIPPVKYYNVFNMFMAPGRGVIAERIEWQKTLDLWNRRPFVHPDYVPAENIKNFTSGNWVYTQWNSINTSLIADFNALKSALKPTSGNTVGTVFTALQQAINRTIARADNATTLTGLAYLPYFTELAIKEENGEDIRPNLEQLCISISEYRVISKIYYMLAGMLSTDPSPLLDSEVEDLANIFIHIRSFFQRFDQVWSEYKVVIGGKQSLLFNGILFRNYKPPIATFANLDFVTYNFWRSPNSYRSEWRDLLESRIEREDTVKDNWKLLLEDVEDRTMPFMRDALIKQLTGPCETSGEAQERLAKKYFIETRDNCCMKHTRISFAIETVQGYLSSLSNGIYDSSLSNFKLDAPYFNAEWKWLGSYASWRSAMFVYIYPENLLHPALRRRQSPAFVDLSQAVSRGNNFSPEDACDAAKEYQKYFDDVRDQGLEIICSTSALANVYTNTSVNDCCGDSTASKYFTYYFAQGKSSKQAYYCWKEYYDNTEFALEFWQTIPIEVENYKLLGCNHLGNWRDRTDSLWLFFSYTDKGKIKLGYVKKNLSDPNSGWKTGEMADIPQQNDKDVIAVIECASDSDLVVPSFIFTYPHPGGPVWQQNNLRIVYATYNYITNTYSLDQNNMIDRYDKTLPIRALSHTCGSAAISFGDNVAMFWPGFVTQYNILWSYSYIPSTNYKVLGLFESKADKTIVVVYRDLDTGDTYIRKFEIVIEPADSSGPAWLNEPQNTFVQLQTGAAVKEIEEIYPFFVEGGYPGCFSVKTKSGSLLGCTLYTTNSPDTLYLNNAYRLTPEITTPIPINSADCIANMGQRKLDVQTNMIRNKTAPSNIPYKHMRVLNEYVNEVYYFAPMLLALDQHKRGQYPSALAWYRSVYDYTNDVGAQRKVYYGLKLEETLSNTVPQYANWLIDPLNPHFIAETRRNAYTKYTLMNIIQCMYAYADREFTLDTIESVPRARRLYTSALDLMNVTGLKVKPDACSNVSIGCIDTSIPMGSARTMPNMYSILQGKLRSLNNVADIEAVTPVIEGYFSGATQETLPSKFALAFEEIDEALADQVHTVRDVDTVLGGVPDAVNDAYRYVFASDHAANFYSNVDTVYTGSVAEVSGVAIDQVATTEAQTKFAWLKTAAPSNSQAYTLKFANDSGQQFFSGDRTYNPVNASSRGYASNSNYTSAARGVSTTGGGGGVSVSLPTYDPLITYDFCMPSNPVYKSLELKGNLELYKIFNCRNIGGMVRELDVYAAATDSSTGMPVIGASGNLVIPGLAVYTPSQYRFKTLIERAKQVCEQAKQMESMFLAAMEKEDAEIYSQITAKQGIETARANVKLQDLRITQAQDESKVASLQLDKFMFMQKNFVDLIDAGLIGFEQDSLDALNRSIHWLENAMTAQIVASMLYIGQGIAYTSAAVSAFGKQDYAAGSSATAGVFGSAAALSSGLAASYSTQSSIDSIKSSIAAQKAGYARREQDWTYQRNLAGKDIDIAKQQIKVAEDNVRIVGQEREIAQLNVSHAEASYEFIKNKFTNAALYNWMGNVLENCYSSMLNLATAVAKTAEGQLYFERQEQAGPFILDDYWETPSSGSVSLSTSSGSDRRGLTGSARLAVDIYRLEQYAVETTRRKLQMTKVISLANNFPSEFQRFRETGVLNFELTNKQFDYDFPGHYLRLINSVRTTVIGLLPVYDSIKATLSTGSISYTVIGGNVFQKIPIRRLEVESVALTSAMASTGVFDMQPNQGELLNPFEGMGVESRWEFKLPQFSNRFDLNNIADVLITVDYTAFDSFQYRYQVLQELDNRITFNRGFTIRNDFPDQWFELGEAQSGTTEFGINFQLTKDNFPQGINSLKLAGDIIVYFLRADGFTDEVKGVEIRLASSTAAFSGSDTNNGKLPTTGLMNTLGNSPIVNLQLLFTNNFTNRELFSNGSIRDIAIIVKCKAELTPYPL